MLKDKIEKFLSVNINRFNDPSYDNANGRGYGCGPGSGSGSGSGTSDRFSFVSNSSGYGYGLSWGSGGNYGFGYGAGSNYGIKELNGNNVYFIDNIQTIFTYIHNNIAKGYMLQSDLQLKPCYIVKGNNKFAHGETLKDAFNSLQEKLYDNSTDEERIEAFMEKFPEYDVKYDNRDLFFYHHILTGSCKMGREVFCKDKGLSLDGKTSVREFVKLTQNAYGGNIIKKLPNAYGIK